MAGSNGSRSNGFPVRFASRLQRPRWTAFWNILVRNFQTVC